jgi:hypothetical protein
LVKKDTSSDQSVLPILAMESLMKEVNAQHPLVTQREVERYLRQINLTHGRVALLSQDTLLRLVRSKVLEST